MQVTLSDGSSFFVPVECASSMALCEGMELDEERLLELRREASWLEAWEKALDLLARREHSRFELDAKLRRREFPEDIRARVLERLTRLGYIDDRRFAGLWVESRVAKKAEGRTRLLAGLAARGIDRSVAREAVDSRFGAGEEEEAILRAVEKLGSAPSATPRSVAAALGRKGFSGTMIYRVVEKFFGSDEGLH